MNILIADASSIVFEGLTGIFHKSGLNASVYRVVSFEEIEQTTAKRRIDLILVNPGMFQNNVKAVNTLKHQFENVKWIGLVYAYYDHSLLSMFDEIITISDSSAMIVATITRLFNTDIQRENSPLLDILSDRETDVLKLLATGLSNKEIADKLNISTNTVITHRKNITQKTGIKSVSGLTIYAVVQKLISLETLTEQ